MRKRWLVVTLFILPFIIYLLLRLTESGGRAVMLLHADDLMAENALLPVVIIPDPTDTPTPTATAMPTATATATATPTNTPTPEPGLLNGSFEDGWTDVAQNSQEPNDWTLYRLPNGAPLFDSQSPEDIADGQCECIHKLNDQLPPDQQVGGPDALILDGLTVYKFQGAFHKWGTELSQTVDNLTPGSTMRLTVPIQIHHQEAGYGEWDAESSIWVNGQGYWANSLDMVDREWCKLEQELEVPGDGSIEVAIRVKVKYPSPKDFFVDDISLTSAADPAPHETMNLCRENPVLIEYQPAKTRR